MAWLYVPGGAALSSDCTSPSQDTGLFVTSSGKPMRRPRSWRGWKTRPWIARLSGTMSPASTLDRGVASWISSLAATRVSPSASPASGGEPRTRGICGRISRGSSASACRRDASLRTSPTIYVLASPKSTRTFAQWATGLRLECSRRLKLARATSASACSSWPTPDTNDRGRINTSSSPNAAAPPTIALAAAMWPTPRAGEGDKFSAGRQRDDSLQQQARTWPTPRANEGNAGSYQRDRGQKGLERPTLNGAGQAARVGRYGTQHGARNLVDDAALWAASSCLSSRPVPATGDGPASCPPRRGLRLLSPTLNCAFTEWLMGWPPGWTDCGCAVTGFSPWLRRMRIELSMLLSRPMVEPNGQRSMW